GAAPAWACARAWPAAQTVMAAESISRTIIAVCLRRILRRRRRPVPGRPSGRLRSLDRLALHEHEREAPEQGGDLPVGAPDGAVGRQAVALVAREQAAADHEIRQ